MKNPGTVTKRSMRMRSGWTLAGGFIAAALALTPATIGASNNDAKNTQVEQKNNDGRKPPADAKGAKAPTDLESCRRDADGMKGPERSRFMTACLKERK